MKLLVLAELHLECAPFDINLETSAFCCPPAEPGFTLMKLDSAASP